MSDSNYKKLIVWQKSITLVSNVYKTTQTFPSHERYGLCSQMQRSAVSIPSNIAEGSLRTTSKDFAKFITIALGSAAELETQLIVSKELHYVNNETLKHLTNSTVEIMKMLNTLQSKLLHKSSS